MRVWRISKAVYASAALDGTGALYASGRWHHRGVPIVYTSATPSLAALEMLVHVDPSLAPDDLRLVEIDVPDDLAVESCDPAALTSEWRTFPAPGALQDFGTRWLTELRTPVLSVPSAVLAVERNFLLNPAHADHARVRVAGESPFAFDPRLLEHGISR